MAAAAGGEEAWAGSEWQPTAHLQQTPSLMTTTPSWDCPVDCIHWTSAAQLSLLKDEMRRVERVNVALMLAGMGSSVDVFRMASSRWQKRQSQVLEQAKIRMMKKRDTDKTEAYWDNIWANPKEYHNSEEEVKERAKRAAAAARRWREYSRRGADKPPSYKLPEAISNNEN
ncbi:unnamed protein product [Malus baccata var. baccata]